MAKKCFRRRVLVSCVCRVSFEGVLFTEEPYYLEEDEEVWQKSYCKAPYLQGPLPIPVERHGSAERLGNRGVRRTGGDNGDQNGPTQGVQKLLTETMSAGAKVGPCTRRGVRRRRLSRRPKPSPRQTLDPHQQTLQQREPDHRVWRNWLPLWNGSIKVPRGGFLRRYYWRRSLEPSPIGGGRGVAARFPRILLPSIVTLVTIRRVRAFRCYRPNEPDLLW